MNYSYFNGVDEEFSMACHDGDFDKIRFFLTAEQYSSCRLLWADNCLRLASSQGFLDIVQYLVNSPALKDFIDIHTGNEHALRWAAQNNHLDIVRYLLQSPEITAAGYTHADIHACRDATFICACRKENFELVDYLIFDYFIDITAQIKHMLNLPSYHDILKKFKTRELMCYLQHQLPENLYYNHRDKI